MKSILPLLSSFVLLASCTASYKSGQTPDDVYFSPTRPQAEYVRTERDDDRPNRDDEYYSYENDRYLRYKIRNRNRWSYLEDYYRDPYAYRYDRRIYYSPYYANYYDYRNYWNYCYNPYGTYVYLNNTRSPIYNRPRVYNLHVFDNPANNSYNPKMPGNASRQYNDPARNTDRYRNTGRDLRNVFGGDRNTSLSTPASSASNSEGSPKRSSSSGSSGSVENVSKGSSGSSGSSSKPIRRN